MHRECNSDFSARAYSVIKVVIFPYKLEVIMLHWRCYTFTGRNTRVGRAKQVDRVRPGDKANRLVPLTSLASTKEASAIVWFSQS